ncbi:MAG: PIN domain-containing protein [Sphingorhabdus sp.]
MDANVLHPAFLRGAMLWFASERLFRPVWSADILVEWRRSLKRRHSDISEEKLDQLQAMMCDQFPDAIVEGYQLIASVLDLPDPDDRHVLAAAIVGKCQGIITANLKHFPADKVAPYQMEVIHPDDFIVNIIDIDRTKALTACRHHRAAMTVSKPSQEEYLERFKIAGLVQAHARLSEKKELL